MHAFLFKRFDGYRSNENKIYMSHSPFLYWFSFSSSEVTEQKTKYLPSSSPWSYARMHMSSRIPFLSHTHIFCPFACYIIGSTLHCSKTIFCLIAFGSLHVYINRSTFLSLIVAYDSILQMSYNLRNHSPTSTILLYFSNFKQCCKNHACTSLLMRTSFSCSPSQ